MHGSRSDNRCSFAQHGRSVRADCAAARRQSEPCRSSAMGRTSAYTRRGDRQPAASQGLSEASRAERLAAGRLGPPQRSPAPAPAASSRRSAARPSRSPAAGCRGQVACRAGALARAGTFCTAQPATGAGRASLGLCARPSHAQDSREPHDSCGLRRARSSVAGRPPAHRPA